MSQIGNVPEINAVKELFGRLQQTNLVKEWELPYEHLLTRLTAAIFFFTPAEGSELSEVWHTLGATEGLRYQLNEERKMSQLEWRVEFNKHAHE